MKLKRMFFLVVGCLCLGIGCVGIALPLLPTFPFFLGTVFCFANSSQKLHSWFVGTGMYQKHLEPFLQKKGMTPGTKAAILVSMTLLLGFGFLMMSKAPAGRILVAAVWLGHAVYFLCGVKTLHREAVKVAKTTAEKNYVPPQ